jgi:predicted nicotinamide N-methyase
MPTNLQIDAPQTLTGLFPDSSDEEDSGGIVEPTFETQDIALVGERLQIRQYDYHSHNANRVWPGTFNLAEYLLNARHGEGLLNWGAVLELGTATGLLAIRLALVSTQHSQDRTSVVYCESIVTSDVEDERGEVAENIAFNYRLNRIEKPPPHVPHTWGTGWKTSMEKAGLDSGTSFDTIIASDILLYVSAYPALVETLEELIPPDSNSKFIMSWNRRMKESQEFFDRIKKVGFDCTHEGKCIYIFKRT